MYSYSAQITIRTQFLQIKAKGGVKANIYHSYVDKIFSMLYLLEIYFLGSGLCAT
jgi:hypothetical protein